MSSVACRLGFATVNLFTKFEISVSNGSEDIKADSKCIENLVV